MKYVYDIELNFNKYYYDFFEWKPEDHITKIKKIKIYKVSSKDYLILKNNEVIIKDYIDKMILVTNSIEIMGLLFNKKGKLLKRSSIKLKDASIILKNCNNINMISIKYLKNINRKVNYLGRNYLERNEYINNFFKRIDLKKDEYLLKYIYFEITNEILDNTNNVYKKLLNIKKYNYKTLYETIKNIKKET